MIIHPGATRDMVESISWYRDRSPKATRQFRAAVQVALHRIAANPEAYPFTDEPYRIYTLSKFPFSIIYRIKCGAIVVIAIAHASRSADYWRMRN